MYTDGVNSQNIAYTTSFYMGLTSAEGEKIIVIFL
jgi:hypothetical protein